MPAANRARSGKLPAEPTSFVGRRRLLAEVKAAMSNTRLLTLVGPGGVGKTRLALRAAADLQRTVRDGAWFVDFAGLDDPHLVPKAVMTSLGLVDRSGQWPTSLLVAHLATRDALLVLDNCEHLLDATAVLVDVLLNEAVGVRLLATSRQPLGISGERVLQVPPLSVGEETGAKGGLGSASSEAVALFVARAADAGVQLEDTDVTRQAVLDLCRRLDGMPLALELAAVRLRTLGLDELLEKLIDRFAILNTGSRTAPPRQQTLRAAIDWSYELLSDPEAALICQLAVFASQFRLDAVEALAARAGIEPGTALALLSSLIEKSFVTREGTATSARYRLHETMREYALLKLREAGNEGEPIKAFVNFYSGMCKKAEEDAQSSRVGESFKRLDDEIDNLRAALRHCLGGPDHAIGLAMVASLVWYWMGRAASEGGYWLDAFLQQPTDATGHDVEPLAHALFARGMVAMTQADLTTASAALTEAEDTAKKLGALHLLARIHAASAGVRALGGDLEGARSALDDAKVSAATLHDAAAEAQLALTESVLALVDIDLEMADQVYAEWAPRLRDRGDVQSLSYLLGSYGFTLLLSSQPGKAEPVFKEALEIERHLDNRDNIVYLLDGLACESAMAGRLQRSARLLAAAARLQAQTGVGLLPHMPPLMEQARQTISSSIAPRTLEAETEAGMQLTQAEAIAFALEEKRGVQAAASAIRTATMPLSKRQREIARLVSDGLSNKEIAARLFLSERTVETHVSNILDHLGVNSRVEIASWVAQEIRSA